VPVHSQTPPAPGTHSRAFAQSPPHVPVPPQSGMPRVVVVNVGHMVLVVVTVLVVEVLQHRLTSPGASCTSFGLHASLTFTVPLKVPVRDGFAQRTAPCAIDSVDSKTANAAKRWRIRPPGAFARSASVLMPSTGVRAAEGRKPRRVDVAGGAGEAQ
jgi:hypothetical protein